jgi:hypothetical protein
MSMLKGLNPDVSRAVLDPHFRTGAQEAIDAGPYLVEAKDLGIGRDVPLEPLRAVVEEAMRRFRGNGTESDAWLGPRVHATLRLTRREAADRRIWAYLTAVEFPDYVRWRWRSVDDPDDTVPIDRFLGEDSRNALARLWWAAELTRNGKDYAPTEKALAVSRFAVSWQGLDALHHRPAALAVVDFLHKFDGKGATDPQGQAMAKAFNLVLRTLALDALCENLATDAEVVRLWCQEPFDVTRWLGDDLPEGPDETPVPAHAVAAVREVLDRLAASINLAAVRTIRTRKRSEARRPASVAVVESDAAQ